MEQLHVLCLIVGRWVLPRYGLSKDQLSQMLLINIGNAADILELFESFEDDDVRSDPLIMILILGIWQASLLQFCFNRTATINIKLAPDTRRRKGARKSQAPGGRQRKRHRTIKVKEAGQQQSGEEKEPRNQESADPAVANNNNQQNLVQTPESEQEAKARGEADQVREAQPVEDQDKSTNGCCCGRGWLDNCLQEDHCGYFFFGSELWAIALSLLLQDVPFLCLRLTLIFAFTVSSHSNVFFTCKNTLLIMLQVYRSVVILQDLRSRRLRAAQRDPVVPLIA
ncbi:unnamed protein product [Schistocephalus solidus]|uniref:DUF4220 domain-containing protein n=1 Tax=Schistocephalus solidus TaxID=70667 RepID=A0A183TSC0_SCHSO|nr:unnamed protein product [Schistocephalus solidus]